MSTRWYPLYQRGNPQLRVYLPNFWMKIVRPEHSQPDNVVQFACSMEMTVYDVKNYLKNIYKVPVVEVRTRIKGAKTKRDPYFHYVKKGDDVKMAYVTLPKDTKFEFPDIFPAESKQEEENERKTLDEMKSGFRDYVDKNKTRPNLPPWFSI